MLEIDWQALKPKAKRFWVRELRRILVETSRVLEAQPQNHDDIEAVSALLEEFLFRAPHRSSWADVRSIARRALRDLFLTDSANIIRDLTAQTAALLAEMEPLVAATEELNQAATELAFEGFIDTLDKAKIVLQGLKTVADSLDENDLNLETVIGMIETIEETLDNLEQTNE